ncbi:glycoside hydrolase family 16 protein [Luethyella okanaganae]|uniref:Family 16 glycosylhydrolase n=1 Tax=Luethyella okanaganae TaxID=69372 RepID=A0ABW1VF97_9MICO
MWIIATSILLVAPTATAASTATAAPTESAQKAITTASTLIDPATPPHAKPLAASKARTLVFSDEFNGTTVDANKWSKRDWARSGAVEPDTWRYDPVNVTTDGRGALEMQVRNTAPSQYTGALIDSRGKFDYTYGTLEARVHTPYQTNGHLAAVWLLPTAGLAPGGVIDGTARDGAEMDIAETNYQADDYTISLHWDAFDAPNHQQSSTLAAAPGLHSTWYHTFGLNWTPTKLEFTYDGNIVRTVTDPTLISQVTEYPLLSHEILDMWADGSVHNEIFDWNSSMYVDYIRVWQ